MNSERKKKLKGLTEEELASKREETKDSYASRKRMGSESEERGGKGSREKY